MKFSDVNAVNGINQLSVLKALLLCHTADEEKGSIDREINVTYSG
jgi:hypothetical protein